MRLIRAFSITLLVILLLGISGGLLWLLDFLAVIDLNKILVKIPVVSKFVYQQDNQEQKIKKPLDLEKTPAEKENEKFIKENKELKTLNNKLTDDFEQVNKELSTLAKQIEVLKKEKQSLIAERDNLNMTLQSLQESKASDEIQTLSYQKLANIYAEMKPAAAVKIMENLTDEVVIGILLQLEDDQVAKILSTMDPQRAAVLVDAMKE